jgi:uncharacterized protein
MASEEAGRSLTVASVFDCMVFLQGAARENGPAAACLRLVQDGYVRQFLTEEILAEVGDVLLRPNIQRRFPDLTAEFVVAFLDRLRELAEMVALCPEVVDLPRDPKDAKYLNLAIASSARYLVSRDNDLLNIMSDPTEASRSIRERLPGLTILDPVEFLAAVRSEIERKQQPGSAGLTG